MKKLFRFLADFFKNQYKANPQILWIPITFIIWAIIAPILRWIDPTAAIFDLGIFMIPVYAIIIFLISTFFVWLFLKKVYGTIYTYLKSGFKKDFEKLTACQKIIISLSVFFLLLFSLVALMGVL
jgi:hypothetical protein